MRLALSRLSSRSSNDKNISLSLSLWLSSKCVLDNDANVLPENLLLLGKLSERERERIRIASKFAFVVDVLDDARISSQVWNFISFAFAGSTRS